MRFIVGKFAVDFVRYQADPALVCQFSHGSNFIRRRANAGWVRGTVQNNHLGFRCDRRFDFFDVNFEIWVATDFDTFPPGHFNHRWIHYKKRIKIDDFVAWVDGCQNGKKQTAAGARANEQLAVVVTKLGIDFGLKFFS